VHLLFQDQLVQDPDLHTAAVLHPDQCLEVIHQVLLLFHPLQEALQEALLQVAAQGEDNLGKISIMF
jgi:hypothetical protein